MNGREKIPASLRRKLILGVLQGEITQAEVVRRYGVDKSHVSRLVSAAREAPGRNLFRAKGKHDDATEEVAFRRRVVEILDGNESQ
jgi:transposase-like protein